MKQVVMAHREIEEVPVCDTRRICCRLVQLLGLPTFMSEELNADAGQL